MRQMVMMMMMMTLLLLSLANPWWQWYHPRLSRLSYGKSIPKWFNTFESLGIPTFLLDLRKGGNVKHSVDYMYNRNWPTQKSISWPSWALYWHDLEDVYKTVDFDELFTRLLDYRDAHDGDLSLPKNCNTDPELGAWVTGIGHWATWARSNESRALATARRGWLQLDLKTQMWIILYETIPCHLWNNTVPLPNNCNEKEPIPRTFGPSKTITSGFGPSRRRISEITWNKCLGINGWNWIQLLFFVLRGVRRRSAAVSSTSVFAAVRLSVLIL